MFSRLLGEPFVSEGLKTLELPLLFLAQALFHIFANQEAATAIACFKAHSSRFSNAAIGSVSVIISCATQAPSQASLSCGWVAPSKRYPSATSYPRFIFKIRVFVQVATPLESRNTNKEGDGLLDRHLVVYGVFQPATGPSKQDVPHNSVSKCGNKNPHRGSASVNTQLFGKSASQMDLFVPPTSLSPFANKFLHIILRLNSPV